METLTFNSICSCYRRGDFSQGLKSGLSSNTPKWIVQGNTHADKATDFIRKERPAGGQKGKGSPRGLLCLMAHSLPFYGDRISFQIVSGQSLLTQDEFPWEEFWEVGRTYGISFWPFSNSFGWWWLVCYVFLTRISHCKITQANSYYGAWPGWAVSVSVSPNIFDKSK